MFEDTKQPCGFPFAVYGFPIVSEKNVLYVIKDQHACVVALFHYACVLHDRIIHIKRMWFPILLLRFPQAISLYGIVVSGPVAAAFAL